MVVVAMMTSLVVVVKVVEVVMTSSVEVVVGGSTLWGWGVWGVWEEAEVGPRPRWQRHWSPAAGGHRQHLLPHRCSPWPVACHVLQPLIPGPDLISPRRGRRT